MSLYRLCVPAILFASFSVFANAQDLPDVAQGLQPYTAYHGGQLDKVSMANGGLSVRIPLVSFPQKGELSLSYSLVFNSSGYQMVETCPTVQGPDGSVDLIVAGPYSCTYQVTPILAGLQKMYGIPTLGPQLVIDQMLQATGSAVTEQFVQSPAPPTNSTYYIVKPDNSESRLALMDDGTYRSVNEDGYMFTPSRAGLVPNGMNVTDVVPGVITDSRGITYKQSPGLASITDLDNNAITFVGGGLAPPVIDSVGRSIPLPAAPTTLVCPTIAGPQSSGGPGSPWTVPGPGSPVTYLFCYTNVAVQTNYSGQPNQPQDEFSRNIPMLQAIVLPNGTYWGFVYDSLGDLTKLIYPTGGSVSYTYNFNNGACDTSRSGYVPDGVSVTTWIPQVATRTMADAQGTVLGTWTYNGNGEIESFLDPMNHLTVNHFWGDASGCGDFDAGQDIHAGPTTSSPILKSTLNHYDGNLAPGYPLASAVRPTNSVTTLDGQISSTISYTYAPSRSFYTVRCLGLNCTEALPVALPLGGPTSATYTDFSGATIKVEKTQYQWQAAPSYLAANLIDLPASTSVVDGNGTPWSTTTYAYDEASYSPGGVRGHPTSTTYSLLTNPSASPITHTVWNSAGEKTSTVDAKGNTTTYSYSSSADTGPTSGFAPTPSASCNGSEVTDTYNALGHHISGTYDCNTGRLLTYTDANSNTTSVSYDAMERLSTVTYPAVPIQGGQTANPVTSFNYNDSANTVTETVLATPDPTQTTTAIFDSFGREIHRSKSGTPNPTTVDTTYDADGRVSTVSNPYYSTGDATYGVTTYTYDALNRKLGQLQPDGASSLTWSYTGPTVDSYDEAGVHMRHTSDALGRLVQVAELGTSSAPLSLTTSYVYDPLGNLTTVNQAGGIGDTLRTRSFSYDSLSRLTSSTNPETGTITYGYLTAGNLCAGDLSLPCSKTDARNITTNYTYDALNRVTAKTAPGINAGFVYDATTAGNFTGQNTVGRLIEQTLIGVTSTQFSYDAMGRIITQGNTLPNGCCVQTANEVSAKYDLAGNMTDLTYPDGRHIQQGFDAAGRLTTSNLVDISGVSTTANYLQGLTYLADNSPGVLTLGNGVQQSITKNSRLQVQNLGVSDPLTNATYLSHTYCYVGCTVQAYPRICDPHCGGSSSTGGNNGNIISIADSLNAARTQGFTYDSLNRIGGFSLGGVLNQQYQIDSFGNMSLMAGTNPISTFDTATNRINNLPCAASVTPFDAAGNQLCGTDQYGGTVQYSYDAENRISAITANSVVTSFETYVYGADGARVRKTNADGSAFTEYVDFGGQPIAEKDQSGNWTDYIYADGKKIAMVPSADHRIHLSGTTVAGGFEWGVGVYTPAAPVVQSGDQVCWQQYNANAVGGINLQMSTSGGIAWLAAAEDGQEINQDFVPGGWQNRCFSMTPYVGQTIQVVELLKDVYTPAGNWSLLFADLSYIAANGTVTQLIPPSYSCSAQTSNPGTDSSLSCVTEDVPVASDPIVTANSRPTHFYLGDHLGTAQLEFSSGGWPVWQGQFAPYGQELDTQTTANHYKFTGKERDTESGLDYFGARYYASNMGRWMSPDWADKPEDVPYSDLADPQSLNLYGYVGNNPLGKADPDGHCPWNFMCDANWSDVWKGAKQGLSGALGGNSGPSLGDMSSSQRQGWLAGSLLAGFATEEEGAGAALVEGMLPKGGASGLGKVGVSAYEVGTYGDLAARSVGDGLAIDHMPSNASNIASQEAKLGRPLNAAEKAAVRDQGTAVAVPSDLHQSASPTFGGRNTPAQIKADAANPQAAAVRDTKAMVNAASPSNKQAAQAAAQKVCTAAGCK